MSCQMPKKGGKCRNLEIESSPAKTLADMGPAATHERDGAARRERLNFARMRVISCRGSCGKVGNVGDDLER